MARTAANARLETRAREARQLARTQNLEQERQRRSRAELVGASADRANAAARRSADAVKALRRAGEWRGADATEWAEDQALQGLMRAVQMPTAQQPTAFQAGFRPRANSSPAILRAVKARNLVPHAVASADLDLQGAGRATRAIGAGRGWDSWD
jgi:hypothetical protein